MENSVTAPHSMTAERWERLKSLFDQALALEGQQQDEFIEQLGVKDPALQQSLQSLVKNHHAAGTLAGEPLISQERIVEYLSTAGRTFQPGELVANRFQIDRFIGEGGMGEVYAARDLDLKQDVALKTLRPCLTNEQFLERFKQEIQTARRVTHPNVCRVFDLFWHKVADGSTSIAFLTMELINGETLDERIRRKGPLTERQALPLVKQVAAGLAAAHLVGIVHRDLKSGNILIVDEGGTERALITDFGLARLVKNDSKAGEGPVEGTPAYVAPEQWGGAAATPAADIYALGVVLFEMVTGTLPFNNADSSTEAVARRESPPSPRTIVPKLNRRWETAILSCLAYQPDGRPETAEAVLEMLGARRISRRTIALTLAGGIGAMVSTRILFRPKQIGAAAWQSFKRGEDFAQRRNADGLQNAIVEFKRVVALEPQYAPAWVGLADAYSALGNFDLMDPREAMEKSKTAARRAVALDNRSARAQGVYGRILSLDLREWLSAEPYFQKAVKLDGNDAAVRLWYGAYLGKLARPKEAMEQLIAGIEQVPSSMPLNQQLAIEFFWERSFPDFLKAAQELVRLQPFESGSHLALARALEWLKQYDEALKSCDEADRLRNTQTSLCYRASVEAARGNKDTGRNMADKLRLYWSKQPFESALLAALYARLDDGQAVLEILDDGYRREDSTVLTAGCNPYFDAVRNEPAFQGFLKKIGWPTRAKI